LVEKGSPKCWRSLSFSQRPRKKLQPIEVFLDPIISIINSLLFLTVYSSSPFRSI
jgi:hypothetical protein